jgi:hypothetical protein
MAWRFVRQPNGRLARFSDIVDHFTHGNLSVEEAIEVCVSEHRLRPEEAKQKVEAGVDDYEPWTLNKKGDGLSRWRHALEAVERVHGKEERDRVELELTIVPSEE